MFTAPYLRLYIKYVNLKAFFSAVFHKGSYCQQFGTAMQDSGWILPIKRSYNQWLNQLCTITLLAPLMRSPQGVILKKFLKRTVKNLPHSKPQIIKHSVNQLNKPSGQQVLCKNRIFKSSNRRTLMLGRFFDQLQMKAAAAPGKNVIY